MNNPILLRTVSGVSFVISGLFTIILMTSGTVGILACILTVGMAVVLELCKCGFMYEALSNLKLNPGIRMIMGIISILLVASSIFASASYVQNQANKTKNIDLEESRQFKELEQGKAFKEDLYGVKKKEIEDLKALQQQQLQKGQEITNSMPKNYITRKNEQRAKTQSQVEETQRLINAKQDELSSLGTDLQKPLDTTNLKLNADNGYTAMFQKLADLFNSSEEYKKNPVKAESLEMWFFIGLGIIFEFVAVLTAYLAQLKSNPDSLWSSSKKDNYTTHNTAGFKPEVVTAIQPSHITSPASGGESIKATLDSPPSMQSVTTIASTIEPIKASIDNVSDVQVSASGSMPSMYFGQTKYPIGFKYDDKNRGRCSTPNVHENVKLDKPDLPDLNQWLNEANPERCLTPNVHGNVINFEKKQIDRKSLHKYLEYIQLNVDGNNVIPGYITTSKELQKQNPEMKFDVETVRKLKAHCENLNILKSDSVTRKTYLLFPFDNLTDLAKYY